VLPIHPQKPPQGHHSAAAPHAPAERTHTHTEREQQQQQQQQHTQWQQRGTKEKNAQHLQQATHSSLKACSGASNAEALLLHRMILQRHQHKEQQQ
jgi:hypothetical protein